MVRRRPFNAVGLMGVFVAAAVALILSAAPAFARAPQLVSAVSRMTHAGAGTFDVQLPLKGGSGIECRDVSKGMTIAQKFDQAIKDADPSIAAGVARISGKPQIKTDTVLVTLT